MAALELLPAPGVRKQGSNASVASGKQRQKPWPQAMGAAQLGRALQGFAGLREKGLGPGALTVLERATTLLHPLPPEGSLQGQRRACCGYHTSEALGKLFQEKGELPVPVSPHHPAFSAWFLSELCLPYPGDSAFTSHKQGHARNHSVPALLLSNLSRTWTLPALESPFPWTCFTHVCVRLEPLSWPAPPCKHRTGSCQVQLHSPRQPSQLFPGSPGTCSICW